VKKALKDVLFVLGLLLALALACGLSVLAWRVFRLEPGHGGELVFVLNLVAALAALGAAVFWFRSAARDLPPMKTYWTQAPPDDPLVMALQAGVRDNRIAAALAGVSAACMALATLMQALGR
jgi:hypothetical protein